VYALHSWISMVDYMVEPEVEFPNSNVNDAVEEFFACGMYPPGSSFDFRDVTVGTTVVSKVKTPLAFFLVEPVSAEDAGCFQAKVETDADRILGSFRPKEHDALMMAKLPNDDRLNQVFEKMGIPYALHPMSGTFCETQ
jgi:hypothetical protein